MTEISEEAIELCANLYDRFVMGGCEPQDACEECQKAIDAGAQKARNDALEEAACIADSFMCGGCGMDGKAGKQIRALKDAPKSREEPHD